MSLKTVALSDKYSIETRRVFLTGTQALVRLCLMQAARDKEAGLKTAGYVSGYRGSPLGAVDTQFMNAADELAAAGVIFEPALNEDLGATALWGTQQAEMRGEGRFDGVFGLWYGKGPGVDRTGDAFRHANMAGSSKHGGVLVLMGDDHTCESSTSAHQSEFAMIDALIPVMNPANLREMIELGLHGIALSRYAGVWCGLKCVKDNVESTASVDVALDSVTSRIPADFEIPEAGLNIRAGDNRHDQEVRMHRYKQEAVHAYIRANKLNSVTVSGGESPRIGIISTGKSYMDTLQALAELDIDEGSAEKFGVSVFKVAMPWPLEPTGIVDFAQDLDLIIVVEEKRGLIEEQVKSILYDVDSAPTVIGKRDENRQVMLQPEGALNPMQIAEVIGTRVATATRDNGLQTRVEEINELLDRERDELSVKRAPYFCAGCPHNSSTVVPEGSRAYAGIGCHWMVQIMERKTEGSTQMGGEGANWIGESHFSTRRHVFQNIGDGTYNHSGLLAIRAAIAASTNITFKLLFNDAVAMTGGQTHEGGLSPYDIAHEVVAAGARKVVVVSDQPDAVVQKQMPRDVAVHHRRDLMGVQQELAGIDGTTVLIYEQTCAAEKRRRRKRGTLEDPPKRVFINTAVCEGCGDCGVQSNCVAILAEDTDLGRKRKIDQSACNKDFSCVNGFCPSFVLLEGAELRKPEALSLQLPDVPQPARQVGLEEPYSIVLTGVGGTGVVTIGALLGMAAHVEGLGCGIIDMAGLAQKGGAVVSHIKIGATPESIKAIRIADGGADLLLGCDELVSTEEHIVRTLDRERSQLVINTVERLPGDFTRNPDFSLPSGEMRNRLKDALVVGRSHFVNADRIAKALLGDSIGSNLFMLGVSYQLGLIPISSDAIERAVELNGVAVEFNHKAFHWGRAWVNDPETVTGQLAETSSSQTVDNPVADKTLIDTSLSTTELIADRVERLVHYQSRAYANVFERFMAKVSEQDTDPQQELTREVAKSGFKLMAYKDEYEVARLYSDGEFAKNIEKNFTGSHSINLYLAPPLLSRRDPASGQVSKKVFGPWVFKVLKVLSKMKRLRGTPFDVFGYTQERRMERRLVKDYQAMILESINETDLQDDDRYQTLCKLASLPQSVRGFGHVKLRNVEEYEIRKSQLLQSLKFPVVKIREVA